MALTIFYRSDLYEAGYTEDHEVIVRHRYYVVAEAGDGRRWVHNHYFSGHLMGDHEAGAAADRLVRRIERAQAAGEWKGPAQPHWTETTPCYGSQAYSKNWREYEAEAAQLDAA